MSVLKGIGDRTIPAMGFVIELLRSFKAYSLFVLLMYFSIFSKHERTKLVQYIKNRAGGFGLISQ